MNELSWIYDVHAKPKIRPIAFHQDDSDDIFKSYMLDPGIQNIMLEIEDNDWCRSEGVDGTGDTHAHAHAHAHTHAHTPTCKSHIQPTDHYLDLDLSGEFDCEVKCLDNGQMYDMKAVMTEYYEKDVTLKTKQLEMAHMEKLFNERQNGNSDTLITLDTHNPSPLPIMSVDDEIDAILNESHVRDERLGSVTEPADLDTEWLIL